jgi:hypothetical protein
MKHNLIQSEHVTEEQRSLLSSLGNFRMMEFKPLYPLSEYQAALDAVNASLKPAHVKVLMVKIEEILQFAENFGKGLEKMDLTFVAKTYREGLEDLPADLLTEAVSQLKRDYKWTHKYPTPADLRERIMYRLEARRTLRWKLNGVLDNWPDDDA